jgi:hypothetical protein
MLLGGCTSLKSPAEEGAYYLFPFENDLEGWVVKGADLGEPPVTWSITRSGEVTRGGRSAAIFNLSNTNGQAKIWLERIFPMEPGQRYRVRVEYDFASADWGDVNLWRLVTGVAPGQFHGSDDLVYQGDTGNGLGSAAGYQWLEKAYDFTVQADAEGKVYAAIGIWGTWEAERRYFLDNVRITFTRDTAS